MYDGVITNERISGCEENHSI